MKSAMSAAHHKEKIMARWKKTMLDRFWAKVWVDKHTDCWLWTGKIANRGYAVISKGTKRYLAHRWAYGHFIGPIRPDQHAHHTCQTPRCVNPYHIKPVTPLEHSLLTPRSPASILRNSTHCKRGHEFTVSNTYNDTQGHRRCRRCAAIAQYRRNHPETVAA